jgi:hypothetical protein
MLRNTIVRRIDLPNVQPVSSIDQRFEQLEDEQPIRTSQKTFNVLENEGARFEPSNEPTEFSH